MSHVCIIYLCCTVNCFLFHWLLRHNRVWISDGGSMSCMTGGALAMAIAMSDGVRKHS